MITDSNQACLAKMTGRKLQEVVLGRKFGGGLNLNGGLKRLKAFEKALRTYLTILNYPGKSRDTC